MSDPTPHPAVPAPRRAMVIGLLLGAALAAPLGALLAFLARTPPPPPPPAFSVGRGEVRLSPGSPTRALLQVAEARRGDPLPPPPVTARVAAVETRTAPSFAPLDGRVDQLAVRLGDAVKQGDRLVLVRSGDLATMLREVRASTAGVQTKRALAERTRLLVESRAGTENDLLVVRNDLREAELAAQASAARLRSLSIQPQADNLYWVLANRSGTVVQLDATPGQHVGPGKERPVATVADLDEVLVLADMPQQDADDLRPGSVAHIWASGPGGEPLEGRVTTVSQVVDPDRQTVPIRISVQNERRLLRPNAFVEAVFRSGIGDPVVLVPTEAVVSDGLRTVVFVQAEDGRYLRREVQVGRQHQGQSEILGGLKGGEHVVTRGALLLLNALDLQE